MFVPSRAFIVISILLWGALAPIHAAAQNSLAGTTPLTLHFDFVELANDAPSTLPTSLCVAMEQNEFDCIENNNNQWQGYGHICFAGEISLTNQQIPCLADTSSTDPSKTNSIFIGNGTSDPGKKVMHQLISDRAGDFTQDFLKDKLSNKPLVAQDLLIGELNSHFVMDLNSSDYETDNSANIISNQVAIKEPSELADKTSTTFDVAATDVDTVDIGVRHKFARSWPIDGLTPNRNSDRLNRNISPANPYTYTKPYTYNGGIDPGMVITQGKIKNSR